jgi:hypothetical protein
MANILAAQLSFPQAHLPNSERRAEGSSVKRRSSVRDMINKHGKLRPDVPTDFF